MVTRRFVWIAGAAAGTGVFLCLILLAGLRFKSQDLFWFPVVYIPLIGTAIYYTGVWAERFASRSPTAKKAFFYKAGVAVLGCLLCFTYAQGKIVSAGVFGLPSIGVLVVIDIGRRRYFSYRRKRKMLLQREQYMQEFSALFERVFVENLRSSINQVEFRWQPDPLQGTVEVYIRPTLGRYPTYPKDMGNMTWDVDEVMKVTNHLPIRVGEFRAGADGEFVAAWIIDINGPQLEAATWV